MAQVKAQELRIGNLVYQGAKIPTQATAETIFNLSKGLISIKPIPLTEERLVKFGFEIETKYSHSMGYKKNYKVYRKDLFTYNGIQAAWWFDNKVLRIQPEYAHQLQNLFHTLTGEELTINHRSRPRGL